MQLKTQALEANVKTYPVGNQSQVIIYPSGTDEFGEYREPQMVVDGFQVDWNTPTAKFIREAIAELVQD